MLKDETRVKELMQTLRPRSNACERAGRGQGKGCGTRAAVRRAGETLPHSHASPPTHRVRGDGRESRRRRRGPSPGQRAETGG